MSDLTFAQRLRVYAADGTDVVVTPETAKKIASLLEAYEENLRNDKLIYKALSELEREKASYKRSKSILIWVQAALVIFAVYQLFKI